MLLFSCKENIHGIKRAAVRRKFVKFKVGEFISKPITGVCKVEDILHPNMNGVKNDALYYLLIPIENSREKIYIPVTSSKYNLRLCLTAEEAWNLIRKIPVIQELQIANEKQREQIYRDEIKTNDPEALVSVIKLIYQRRKTRLEQGKKSISLDEKYFEMAENLLYMELGKALGKPKQDICQMIIDYLDQI